MDIRSKRNLPEASQKIKTRNYRGKLAFFHSSVVLTKCWKRVESEADKGVAECSTYTAWLL
jgi:hypothetical protein